MSTDASARPPIEKACYWLAKHRRDPDPPLEGTRDADVVIVGAGFTGLWTALQLKQLDPRLGVVVLEQGVAAYGASGRNAGMLGESIDHSHELAVAHFGRDEAARMAARLESAFTEPFVLDGGEFFLSVSVGIAVADSDSDAYGLIRDADAAMYSAKEGGRARHAMFDDGLRRRALARVTLETELRRGIEREEFALYFQPIRDLRSGRWVALEALVRWHHPTRGLLGPDEFIPLAEETGLIVPLGQRLIDRAVRQVAILRQVGTPIRVAINLSVVQLSDPGMPDELQQSLRSHDVPAQFVVVEITETGLMQRLDAARGALEQIANLGVSVVIDDFGTGYSSIARLGELPVVAIKVDRRFTQDLGVDPDVGLVLGAITDLAHALDLRVIAEGVETAAALAAASELGCDYAQGYHLARPAPAGEIESVLQ